MPERHHRSDLLQKDSISGFQLAIMHSEFKAWRSLGICERNVLRSDRIPTWGHAVAVNEDRCGLSHTHTTLSVLIRVKRRCPNLQKALFHGDQLCCSYPTRQLGADRGADRGAKSVIHRQHPELSLCFYLVGVAGFEPATPSSRTRCDPGRPLNDQRFSSTSDSPSFHAKLWPTSAGPRTAVRSALLYVPPRSALPVPWHHVGAHRPGTLGPRTPP